MKDIQQFFPVEEISNQEYSPERADALITKYYEKLQSIANDGFLTDEQKKTEVERLSLSLGYILLTEYNRTQTK